MTDEAVPFRHDATPTEVAVSERPRRRRAWLALIPLFLVAFAAYTVRLPYFVIGPGPAVDVEPLIHTTGTHTYSSSGHFLLTSVNEHQANAFDLLTAWIDPASTVVPERDILAPGQTQEQEIQVARSEMDTSKIDAAVVALTDEAGYPGTSRPGALIEAVVPDTPADGKLFPGDVIASIDGSPVKDPEELGRLIVAGGAGHPLHLTVNGRPGGAVHVTVTPRYDARAKRAIMGVTSVPNFPFPLTISSGSIGGPSAGLMWTLGLTDLLTPGDLTGGRKIAGTGAIDASGKVYPIGGVQEKVVAARRAGAGLFFVPRENAADARSVADGMTIVEVNTVQDAVQYLEQHR
jgi:PDZ domain-containing protein